MSNEPNNTDWPPIVAFYFKVSFQGGVQCDASFSEVKGLEVKLEINKDNQIERITPSDLVLRRAMQPLSEELSKWITSCISLDSFIETCTVVISLMNQEKVEVASWSCSKAYPKEWSLDTFNADKSELAMETLTLAYSTLKRIK